MDETPSRDDRPPPRTERVHFRANRSRRQRVKDWKRRADLEEGGSLDSAQGESLQAKGDLSRKRTVKIDAPVDSELREGRIVAIRGRYNEVHAEGVAWLCTLRRILRTRRIDARNPLTVGDRVLFRESSAASGGALPEGSIEHIQPRVSELCRRVGRRTAVVAANVELAVIVTSAAAPLPKAHLVDRYMVAALHGGIEPMVCLNKIDLDRAAAALLDRYRELGYTALAVSAMTGENIPALRERLAGRSSVLAGQSGVGKTALLNALQPGWNLRTGTLDRKHGKGRHTTTNAQLHALDSGGTIVDTPGVRSLDVSLVAKFELEKYFVEFLEHVPHCKFADCTHLHEAECAVIRAVEEGRIHVERYESYGRLFLDPAHEPSYD